ncbi:MAG: ABC transporter permease subunit [Candidatus Aminicenantes bacterium]|nr:ABC transporter permease subunit [Candidatus Aminicenantes bacterium]
MNGAVHLKQSLKDIWKKMLLMGAALYLFEMLFALLATSAKIQTEMLRDVKEAPAALQKLVGEGFMDAILKYGLITFGYIHPLMFTLFILFIFTAFRQVLAAEIVSGTIGFTLSRPISRKRIYLNLAIIVYAGLAFLALVVFLSTASGIALFHGGKLSPGHFVSLSWNLYLLMVFCAGYIALFSYFTDSGKNFYTYSTVFLFLCYILDMAANLWSPLKFLAPINPFSYYQPMKILTGSRVDFTQSVIILLISGIMFFISALLFNRRDLPNG